MVRWLNNLQPWGVVLLRYVVGFTLLYHGWGKAVPAHVLHHGHWMAAIDQWCHRVTALGVPYWMGYLTVFAEVVGGAALIVGLFVRFFALLIAGNMVMAIALVTWHKGYAGSEYPIAVFAMAIMLLLTGPGRWALDRRLGLV